MLTSADLAASAMVRRLVTNMMNSTLRKLEVSRAAGAAVCVAFGVAFGFRIKERACVGAKRFVK